MNNITTRELLDLEDHLRLEGSNIMGFNHFARECQDPQLKSFCQEMSHRRMQAFQMLSRHIGVNMQ
ncbi:hypothetical protein [Desulfofalx alkaliphila]|uniref:hypothetical protein n=1 Tax=Desulfofalx alkaliphila TaxID=105483 RepID=UPI0004E24BEA|nr:hypothetical protein [Desulfofalx alkaliphila]